ncbi:hypothetical protein C5167_016521, partial [Papaver somniferum]
GDRFQAYDGSARLQIMPFELFASLLSGLKRQVQKKRKEMDMLNCTYTWWCMSINNFRASLQLLWKQHISNLMQGVLHHPSLKLQIGFKGDRFQAYDGSARLQIMPFELFASLLSGGDRFQAYDGSARLQIMPFELFASLLSGYALPTCLWCLRG